MSAIIYDFPAYDLDRLRAVARVRLIEDGRDPTDLNIYKLIAVLRAEEIGAAARGRRLFTETPAPVAGGMTEEIPHGC